MEPSEEYKTAYENNLLTLSDNQIEAWRRGNLYDSTNNELDDEAKAIATYHVQACEKEQARRTADMANNA